ncbi:unnamed protein product [Coregonus sp. 'balchen']|uniref:Uncharacterized protein n=1 Tax=Coregonus suidteri TaxID=861788 RepID=A0AAN8R5R8_9TELE|nr:unnamed protein product [Coregonus sp. 'balchen']
MKADITLALSMLCLVLLIFVHEAMPAPNGTFFNDTLTENTSVRDGLLNDSSISTDQSTPEKHDRGMHGDHSVMTTDSPNGTPTSTGIQTSATSGSPTQQTENTTPPPPTNPISLPKTPPTISTPPFSNQHPSGQLSTGSIVVVVLIPIILILLIIVLFFYKWNTRHSGQDSSAPRLLLGIRERMRGGVRSLEDGLGLRLWPGKRVVEEEGEEEGKGGDGEAAVGVRGGQRDEDEGDSSDDYSSLDGIDLSERAKNLEDEEKKEEAAVKRKSGSEGGQDDMNGERTDGRKEGGEEERTGEIPGEEKSEGETCDLTAL